MEWVKTKFLGKGAYGTVFLAEPLLDLNAPYVDDSPDFLAVKSARLRDSSSVDLDEECLILHALDGCPHIIRCYGDNISIEDGEYLINLLLEYAPGGTLSDLICSRDDKTELEISMYAYMLLMGIREIHEKGFVHCDLKPDNILVFPSTKGGKLVNRLKIADFGLAKRVGFPSDSVNKESYYIRGTPLYCSPESILNDENEPPRDIWSFGCIMIEIITGSSPYSKNVKKDNLLDTIAFDEELPQMPSIISKKLKDFLSKCFIRKPKERWTASMLLNHPFIVDCCKELNNEEKVQMNWEDEDIGDTQWSSSQSSISTRRPKCVRYHPYL